MENFEIYIILFGTIVVIAHLFHKSPVPISLLLVICGMLISFLPNIPHVTLSPALVLNIFLPILIYQISSFSSWKDMKKNVVPISLLSVGHVIFIAILVAVVIHTILPQLGWALSLVLGAVIAPPDDVAIVSIAEKIRMPKKVVTILEGEGLLNDATALILFRFALAAVVTHEFLISKAILDFLLVVVCETVYGLCLGYLLGELRVRLRNNLTLHIILSLLTPFLAYLPAEKLGGCGVLATVVTGFVIGHIYATRFTPEFRLFSLSFWSMLAFAIQSLLFFLVGLNMRFVLERISVISPSSLALYSLAAILTVIIGRFIWVYLAMVFLPRLLFSRYRKIQQQSPWQYPLIVSWAGMRGGISLAAAFAVPNFPVTIDGIGVRDLLIFLVFSVIAATLLLQGLTLPLLLKIIGIKKYGQKEDLDEVAAEASARMKMITAVLEWLAAYQKTIVDNTHLSERINLLIKEYALYKKELDEKTTLTDQQSEQNQKLKSAHEHYLFAQIIEIEKSELIKLWHSEKISLSVRNKLLARLDHRSKHLPDLG